ncbi:hypothetical protein JOM56_006307 [Amanita muscaria]
MLHASRLQRYIIPMISLFRASLSSVQIPAEMKIELTDSERILCTLLDDCSKNLNNEENADVACRIAGGWVRDKLLGLQCNDIDVALSDIMGLRFAERLASLASERGADIGTIGKIDQNPDQSKHLETATLRIDDLDVDFVNLRNEEYASESRIPTQVTFGTPLQDALRRDITINSLFYNIHTRTVEDFTEKGLSDLRDGIIRTPLPPKETFLDDPLRILRCIRFAGRFGFTLVPEIEDAAKDPEIQEALVSKIARERVGVEIAKMLEGRDTLHSIRLLHALSLYDAVFTVLPKEIKVAFSNDVDSSERALASATILHALLAEDDRDLPQLHPLLFLAVKADPSCIPRLYLASILTPFANVTYTDKKKKLHPATEAVLRESLRLGTQNHYLDGIPSLFTASQILRDALGDSQRLENPSPRVAIGTLLRQKSVHNPHTGSHWTSSILFSLVQDLIPFYMVDKDQLNYPDAVEIIGRYDSFLKQIEELDLVRVADLKPLIDGRELLKVTGASKGGSWTGGLLARILEWQLENPAATKDACIEWLNNEKKAGRLSLTDDVPADPVSKRARTR